MYYPKFHYKLNHIEYFWCNEKNWIRRNCKYNIEGLKEDIFKTSAQIKGSTILRNYKSCLKKSDLYRENIQYGINEEKKLNSYKKIWLINDDRYII